MAAQELRKLNAIIKKLNGRKGGEESKVVPFMSRLFSFQFFPHQ